MDDEKSRAERSLQYVDSLADAWVHEIGIVFWCCIRQLQHAKRSIASPMERTKIILNDVIRHDCAALRSLNVWIHQDFALCSSKVVLHRAVRHVEYKSALGLLPCSRRGRATLWLHGVQRVCLCPVETCGRSCSRRFCSQSRLSGVSLEQLSLDALCELLRLTGENFVKASCRGLTLPLWTGRPCRALSAQPFFFSAAGVSLWFKQLPFVQR